MGDPMDRFFRPNPQRGRSTWAAIAVGVVTIVALAMLLTGMADAAETVATLLVAPVFVVALYRGRTWGLAAAGAAAVVYAWFRLSDGDGAEAAGVGLLVLSRAGLYGLTAYAAPWVATHMPPIPMAARGRHRRRDSGRPGARADDAMRMRELELLGWDDGSRAPAHVAPMAAGSPSYGQPEPHDYDDAQDAEGDEDDEDGRLPVQPLWEEPLDPALMTPPGGVALGDVGWDHPTETHAVTGNGGSHGEEASGLAPALPHGEPVALDEGAMADAGPPPGLPVSWDGPPPVVPTWEDPPGGAPAAWEDPHVPAALGFGDGPVAPSLPTGWIDDATSPPGDENIPVGFTGELFLPHDLQDAPPPDDGLGGYRPPPSIPVDNGSPGPYPPSPAPESPAESWSREPRPYTPPPPPVPEHTSAPASVPVPPPSASSEVVDPETRLWNARFFRDRLTAERDRAHREGGYFSVVMIQVPDAPFQPLPYRRQVALLRELGHQFVQARVVDHLVHLPDGAQHWFAVVLGGSDRSEAHLIERRLRTAIGGYLRSRGLQVAELQSASLTSPDDDEAMASIWASLLGSHV